MKLLIALALFFTISNIQAQGFSGQVVDEKTNEPLPFVNITVNGSKVGTASDIDGRFILPYKIESVHYLEFSFIGYKKLKARDVKDGQVYRLREITEDLPEVTVLPGINPAHRIIENAVENKSRNRPESLDAFAYKTYSKFVLGLNVDSVDATIDTISKTVRDSTFTEYDSTGYEMVEFAGKQHLLVMETVTERKFLAPSRDNETVLAQRTSGFKNPLFSLIATQLQAFSFYGDYFSMVGEDFLNPLTPGSTKKYFFILEDTTYNDVWDTVYTISFRPRPNYTFRPMRGRISINSRDWAIQNVTASPVWEENENSLDLTIQQHYQKFGVRTWFPVQLNALLSFERDQEGSQVYGNMRTYIKQVEINPVLRKNKVSLAKISIDELAVENAEELLGQFRNDSLDAKEKETYRVVDSIGEAENLDKQLELLATLLSGRIPLYYVDLELNKIIGFNAYEGFRLGLGLHTNSRFSRWFEIGGYFGYGFRDQVWKYGYDASATLNKVYNLKAYGGYSFDLSETGASTNFLQGTSGGLFADNYRQLFAQQFDENSKVYAGLSFDPAPSLSTNLRLQRENRLTIGNYRYLVENTAEATRLQNGFNYSELVLGLRYSPNEEVLEAGEYGRISLKEATPVFLLDIAQSLPNVWGARFDYLKIDFKANYTRKSLSWGRSIFELQAGKVFTDGVPFSKLYAGTANGIRNADFLERARAIADRSSFETMQFNEFLNDMYIHLMFRQDFRSILFKKGDFAPHIEVVSRAIWGSLSSPELHQNISTRDLSKGYYESGLELNKLYKLNFSAFGLGFYYRYGPYTFDEFLDNFTVKFTSKFSF